jgi:hypothetical protein
MKPKVDARTDRKRSETLLFLGCFSFFQPGDPAQEGTFQVVAEAVTPETAVETFRRRLDFLRDTTTLFHAPVTIYLDGIIQLSGSFKKGLLVNYQSGGAAPRPRGTIMCTIPEQKGHKSVDYSWAPEPNGDNDAPTLEAPFVDYGGVKLQEALERLKKPKDADWVAFPSSPPLPSRATQPEIATSQSGSKVPVDAGAEQARKRAEREAEAKRKREQAALEATLAELDGKRPSSRRPK